MTRQDLETSLLLLGWAKSIIHSDAWWYEAKTMQRICIYKKPTAFKVSGKLMCRGTHDFNGKMITYHSSWKTLLNMAIGDKYEPPDNSQSVSRDDLAGRDADVIIIDELDL